MARINDIVITNPPPQRKNTTLHLPPPPHTHTHTQAQI
jgi:hypothetical protein